jgi:hypothetical protein
MIDNMIEAGLNTYDRVMNIVVSHAKVNQQQIEELMDKIAYHETGPNQRNLPEAIQEGSVPYGRGLYQYEMALGRPLNKSGARTAMNRLYKVLGGVLPSEGGESPRDPINMPDWMKPYFKRNVNNDYEAEGEVDFSKLTEKQQKTAFLADKLKTKGAIPNIGMDKDSKWWSLYHHKGDSNIKGFEEDSGRYSFQKHRLKALGNAFQRAYK